MEDKDLEKFSFDDFDEDEFMLNVKKENEVIFTEDDIIDSPIEKDLNEKVEIMEELEYLEEKVVETGEVENIENKAEVEEASKKEKKQKVKKEKTSKKKKDKSKKEKKKGFKFPEDKKGRIIYVLEAIFCLISIIFIIYCCYYYGSRLIKYYRIYNPKTESGEVITLIAQTLNNSASYATEGDGIYRLGGASIYKGENVDNYFLFSNQLWRILSINQDGSIELITDSYINALNFDDDKATYSESLINKYLNEVYIKSLDQSYLATTSYCLDEVEDLSKVTCETQKNDNYVRLLSLTEFLNSKIGESTYLNSNEGFWLYNSFKENAWIVVENNLSTTGIKNSHLIKPVIRLKNSNILLGGKGTKEEPYYIEKDTKDLKIGDYVQLGDDKWIIYDVFEENINLALDDNLSNTYRFSTTSNLYNINDTNSLASYLNTTYLDSLPYKDIINEHNWYIGKYTNNYEDVLTKTTTAKVGLYNVADLKIGNAEEMYYLITPSEKGYTYYYDSNLIKSKINLSRNIKPTININKNKILSGNGSLNNPYVLEVK